mmetsp:Transcript_17018/g.28824  ORF Transcript_17018/g.28824 Transcript_17018/m.28824 type:complete len:205 (-) Transcript_17018:91-705(-)
MSEQKETIEDREDLESQQRIESPVAPVVLEKNVIQSGESLNRFGSMYSDYSPFRISDETVDQIAYLSSQKEENDEGKQWGTMRIQGKLPQFRSGRVENNDRSQNLANFGSGYSSYAPYAYIPRQRQRDPSCISTNQTLFQEDPWLGFALMGYAFSWLPPVGWLNFAFNYTAPFDSARREFAYTSCYIASFVAIVNIVFWSIYYM